MPSCVPPTPPRRGKGSKNGSAPFTISTRQHWFLPKPVRLPSMKPKIRRHCSSASTPVSQQNTCGQPWPLSGSSYAHQMTTTYKNCWVAISRCGDFSPRFGTPWNSSLLQEGDQRCKQFSFSSRLRGDREHSSNGLLALSSHDPGNAMSWSAIPLQNRGQPETRVNHQAYTVCVVERLHEGLRRHDVFVEPSEHWGDPRAKLLQPEQWEGIRPQICQTLGREIEASRALESLGQQLEDAYQRTAANVPSNAALQIEQRDGADVPNLERLEHLDE